jgi:hypothetical protein
VSEVVNDGWLNSNIYSKLSLKPPKHVELLDYMFEARPTPGRSALGVQCGDLGPDLGYPPGRGAWRHDLARRVPALPVAIAGEQSAAPSVLVLHDDQAGDDRVVKLSPRPQAMRGQAGGAQYVRLRDAGHGRHDVRKLAHPVTSA